MVRKSENEKGETKMTATATETRAPNAAEIAETNVLQSAAEKFSDTIQTRAAARAIESLGESESKTWSAVTMLALNLCGEQIRAVLTDDNYDPQKDNWIFTRDILVPVARAGKMIYRGTEDKAAAIMLATGKLDRLSGDAFKAAESERNKLAAEYVKLRHTGEMRNGKPVNVKLIDSLSTLKTYGMRLAAFMRVNHKPVILECARAASVESAETMWNAQISALLSAQWGIMQSRLAEFHEMSKADSSDKPAKAKAEKAEAPEAGDTEAQEPARELTESEKLAAILAAVDTLSIDALMTLQGHINAKVGAAMAEAKPEAPVVLMLPAPEAKPAKAKRNRGRKAA
ncbi:hypothetical protein [Bradyrhizobium sp. SZCCHNR3118]|uniref:hypothetical protein n=1 Tax=Bradyrhizobium sp. SZCCHNR3118 TaxID=3057468 RepID=UPI002915F60B|nr:hypothetical protein [Bradyrhizobium sp. SZCCHNR3118]